MNLKRADEYYNSGEYLTKIRNRVQQLKSCADDDFHRARMILDVWSNDPVEFIETFLFLKLPNYHNAIKPFFLFDYQKKIIWKLLECEQDTKDHVILIDKPREMGITWVIVAYYYWRWLFTPDWSGFILSRTETEVDDGSTTPDGSIFGKLRWLINNTPKFMLADGFLSKGKKGTSTDMMLKMINPQLKTLIGGSSTNTNAGRSRRYSVTFIDECFYIENFAQVWRSLESVSRVKVFVSSAKASYQNKRFMEMCEKNGDYVHLEWSDHPWKDAEWFAELERKAEFDPEIMREAVVSYAIDKKSQYYPQIDQATVRKIEYDKNRPVYISLDIGRGDLTVIIWWQYVAGEFRIIECYSNKNKDIEWYAVFMNPELDFSMERYPTTHQRELIKKIKTWSKPRAWFGEQDHFKKSMASNLSCADVLHKYGIRLIYNRYAINYEPRRKATIMILPMVVFNDDDGGYVGELYDAMINSRYATMVAPTSPDSALKPVHDNEIADYRSAFENGAVNIPRVLKLQREESRNEETRTLTNNLVRYIRTS